MLSLVTQWPLGPALCLSHHSKQMELHRCTRNSMGAPGLWTVVSPSLPSRRAGRPDLRPLRAPNT